MFAVAMDLTTKNFRINLVDVYDLNAFCDKDTRRYTNLDSLESENTASVGISIFNPDSSERNHSAVVGSDGGATAVHDKCCIITGNKLILCCANSIFCLSLPNLKLLWKLKGDTATCFGIYEFENDFIVHGELEITRIDGSGNVKWSVSGKDIFTSLNEANTFRLSPNHIEVYDWENNRYRIGYNGTIEIV